VPESSCSASDSLLGSHQLFFVFKLPGADHRGGCCRAAKPLISPEPSAAPAAKRLSARAARLTFFPRPPRGGAVMFMLCAMAMVLRTDKAVGCRQLRPRKGFAASAKAAPVPATNFATHGTTPGDYAINYTSDHAVHVPAQHAACFPAAGNSCDYSSNDSCDAAWYEATQLETSFSTCGPFAASPSALEKALASVCRARILASASRRHLLFLLIAPFI